MTHPDNYRYRIHLHWWQLNIYPANTNIFVSTIGTMLCVAPYFQMVTIIVTIWKYGAMQCYTVLYGAIRCYTMSGLNLNMWSRNETCHFLHKSKHFNKFKLCSMILTDHKNGTPSIVRRPRLVNNKQIERGLARLRFVPAHAVQLSSPFIWSHLKKPEWGSRVLSKMPLSEIGFCFNHNHQSEAWACEYVCKIIIEYYFVCRHDTEREWDGV